MSIFFKASFCVLTFSSVLIAEQGMLEPLQTAMLGQKIVLPVSLALMAGFLSALSPCVYPLIPITLSLMGAKKHEPARGFLKALVYTLGMALVYSALGITFAYFGILLGSLMQHPVVLLLLAMSLAVMSLSMFGVFNLVLPPKLMARLTRFHGQGYKGAFLMGLVAGLLAAPCTGPVLGVILTIIAEQKDLGRGLVLMLAFSLGMGAPFLILGTFSHAILHLPKSGWWMDKLKFILGALMMGVALYYVGQAWPNMRLLQLEQLNIKALIGFLVLGVLAIILPLNHRVQQLQVIIGSVMLCVTLAAMLAFEKPQVYTTEALSWHVINDQTKDVLTFDNLLKHAQNNHQPVLIDFYADWCKACKELEHLTFSESRVASHLQNWLLVRIDATKSSDYLSTLQNRYQIVGLPTMVLSAAKKSERIVGFVPPEQLLALLKLMAQ